jgi:hypothetical protein
MRQTTTLFLSLSLFQKETMRFAPLSLSLSAGEPKRESGGGRLMRVLVCRGFERVGARRGLRRCEGAAASALSTARHSGFFVVFFTGKKSLYSGPYACHHAIAATPK